MIDMGGQHDWKFGGPLGVPRGVIVIGVPQRCSVPVGFRSALSRNVSGGISMAGTCVATQTSTSIGAIITGHTLRGHGRPSITNPASQPRALNPIGELDGKFSKVAGSTTHTDLKRRVRTHTV